MSQNQQNNHAKCEILNMIETNNLNELQVAFTRNGEIEQINLNAKIFSYKEYYKEYYAIKSKKQNNQDNVEMPSTHRRT